MPNGGLSVGRDLTLRFNFVSGELVFPNDSIESFEATTKAPIQEFIPLSGILDPALFHLGWDIKMVAARKSNLMDQFWALAEAEYYAGVPQPGGTITQTIQESNGSVSQYIFTNFVMKLDNVGMWKGNEFITYSISGVASRRLELL